MITMPSLRCGRYTLPLARPLLMGIVNVTPDSFSDGGQFASTKDALTHCMQLIAEGADILDIGGESTRPNAQPVPLYEELERVIPLIQELTQVCNIPVSIDTYKPQVMRAAIAAGASMINDVCGLQEPGAMEAVANSNAGVCLIHMQGTPQTMQQDPKYEDVVVDVRDFLLARAAKCGEAGISRDRIMIDPGFGFGKQTVHNLTLLRDLEHLCEHGYPVLVGLSRKSVLGKITGNATSDRLPASLAAAIMAVTKGAAVVRVHDVKATRDALTVVSAITHHDIS